MKDSLKWDSKPQTSDLISPGAGCQLPFGFFTPLLLLNLTHTKDHLLLGDHWLAEVASKHQQPKLELIQSGHGRKEYMSTAWLTYYRKEALTLFSKSSLPLCHLMIHHQNGTRLKWVRIW